MIAAAVLLAATLSGSSPAPSFSVDLFLVARNASTPVGLGWLDTPEGDGKIESLLRPYLAADNAAQRTYLVVDGGTCTLYPSAKSPNQVSTWTRSFDGGDPRDGITTTVGVNSYGGILHVRPLGATKGYTAQTFLHFRPAGKRVSLALQDLNSYETTAQSKRADDREFLDRTLLVTDDSIETAKSFLRSRGYDFRGICLCPRGLADPATPNFIAFPPAGTVGHYTMTYVDGRWSARLVEYLQ